ncbi:MAG: hypothetical protein CTY34_13225 [Methylobacter sp.]|nr:MAG: hypothetical protein CTY34_13225 [Methylobacter sp.]PPD02536.1 MAG: hypothetical protein CTY29_12685 [Methylobacter sp.]
MLHTDILVLLYHFAKHSKGAVLEIGSYLGGATVAMGYGIIDSAQSTPFVTIEPGGSYPHHPWLPTYDILTDLKSNLKKWQIDAYVSLESGNSRDEAVVNSVKQKFENKGIGLLCIDADGEINEDFTIYSHLLNPGAYLVVDDYFCGELKAVPTRNAIDALVDNKKIECLGIYGWGTWVGRVLSS